MYLAIIVLPILGSIVSGFFGRKVGVSGAQLITCLSVIITTIMATIGFFEVGLNNVAVSYSLFRWIDTESLNVMWSFNYDSLTVSMLIPVLTVSSLVHVYSIGYMSHDPHKQRFFSYLSLFTFMMIVLVTSNNFLSMFVGWEGVGVCSYLLVSFWFTRIAANQSSMSAFLTNRVGDCFLTIGMFAMIWTFGNLDYSIVFSLAPYVDGIVVTIIGICLLIGAMAKSSQVGLHVWLPHAMEGPTPVSALIHAATMVTAGVYLLVRASHLIEYSSTVLILCLWIGGITTVFSSLIGFFQLDIKKVIAYSTMSQLGMMVIAVGLSSYSLALFHLVNHAFYKGLLFLSAGAVIHAVADNQDFRKYGGLIASLPLTYTVMLIASLSLVAFPFMTGFYSKDLILESAFGQFNYYSIVVYFIATIGAMFTTLYSVKVLHLTFLTNANGPITNYNNAHEGDVFMNLPLIILAVFSIFFGYISKEMFIGLASAFFSDNSLFIHPLHEIMLSTEFAVAIFFKLLPFFLTILLTVISLTLPEFLPKALIYFKLSRLGYNIFSFFNLRFLVELYYNKYITRFIFKLGGQTVKSLDKGSVESLGPYGLEKGLLRLSESLSKLDSGVITSYALYIVIGLISYLIMPYINIIDITILVLVLFSLVTALTLSFSRDYLKSDVRYILLRILIIATLMLFFFLFAGYIEQFTGINMGGKTLLCQPLEDSAIANVDVPVIVGAIADTGANVDPDAIANVDVPVNVGATPETAPIANVAAGTDAIANVAAGTVNVGDTPETGPIADVAAGTDAIANVNVGPNADTGAGAGANNIYTFIAVDPSVDATQVDTNTGGDSLIDSGNTDSDSEGYITGTEYIEQALIWASDAIGIEQTEGANGQSNDLRFQAENLLTEGEIGGPYGPSGYYEPGNSSYFLNHFYEAGDSYYDAWSGSEPSDYGSTSSEPSYDSSDYGSGDNGSGSDSSDIDSSDHGSGDHGSGDNGSGDNGSGDNGSGDNGSGDNGSDSDPSDT